jgi:hypothetical protein
LGHARGIASAVVGTTILFHQIRCLGGESVADGQFGPLSVAQKRACLRRLSAEKANRAFDGLGRRPGHISEKGLPGRRAYPRGRRVGVIQQDVGCLPRSGVAEGAKDCGEATGASPHRGYGFGRLQAVHLVELLASVGGTTHGRIVSIAFGVVFGEATGADQGRNRLVSNCSDRTPDFVAEDSVMGIGRRQQGIHDIIDEGWLLTQASSSLQQSTLQHAVAVHGSKESRDPTRTHRKQVVVPVLGPDDRMAVGLFPLQWEVAVPVGHIAADDGQHIAIAALGSVAFEEQ